MCTPAFLATASREKSAPSLAPPTANRSPILSRRPQDTAGEMDPNSRRSSDEYSVQRGRRNPLARCCEVGTSHLAAEAHRGCPLPPAHRLAEAARASPLPLNLVGPLRA